MNPYYEDQRYRLEEWQQDLQSVQVDINLLLTLACNHECTHCMFSSGPRRSKQWMSLDDLNQIEDFVKELVDEGHSIEVNLVGGEPTMNLREFERIFNHVKEWGVTMTMTTNGWWLNSFKSLQHFSRIVSAWVEDGEFPIRISNSTWHQEHRAGRVYRIMQQADPNAYLRTLLTEESELRSFYDIPMEIDCPECGEIVNTTESCLEECPECGEDWSESVYELAWERQECNYHKALSPVMALGSAFVDKHIYVDEQGANLSKISPVGRAADPLFGATQDGPCHASDDIKFTFEPGATLHDVCCNGGKMPLGKASDGALKLLAMRHAYMTDLHAAIPGRELCGRRCAECPGFAQEWLVKRGKTIERIAEAYVRDETEEIEEELAAPIH